MIFSMFYMFTPRQSRIVNWLHNSTAMCQLVYVLLCTCENEFFPFVPISFTIFEHLVFLCNIIKNKKCLLPIILDFFVITSFLHSRIFPTRIFESSLTILWQSLICLVLNVIFAMVFLSHCSENSLRVIDICISQCAKWAFELCKMWKYEQNWLIIHDTFPRAQQVFLSISSWQQPNF